MNYLKRENGKWILRVSIPFDKNYTTDYNF
jgi:hypothetical protein